MSEERPLSPEDRVARSVAALRKRRLEDTLVGFGALLVEFTILIHELDPGRVELLLRQRRLALQALRLPPDGKPLSAAKRRDRDAQEQMVALLERALGRES